MGIPDRRKIFFLLLALAAAAVLLWPALAPRKASFPAGGGRSRVRLYWFIPDGLRADPTTFQLFEWARQGLLPNIRRMMESGSYGYSRPVFPGHTPTNFATLLTGSTPRVHGIADGAMHIEGYPLKIVSEGGFSSTAKKEPPIWYTLEQQGIPVTVLSIPGSTPPETDLGATIRGRWGGWGPDFPAVVFHAAGDRDLRLYQGLGNRLFSFGSELTRFLAAGDPAGWKMDLPRSFSPPREVILQDWGETTYAWIYDSTDDGREYYDRALFSRDKRKALADLGEGEESAWLPVTLVWQTNNDYNINTPKRAALERDLSSVSLDTRAMFRVIKLGRRGFFRIRFFYDNLNRFVCRPSSHAEGLEQEAGPMTDFADNFPAQLVYYPEDRQAFLDEAWRSLSWHRDAVGYLFEKTGSQVIIHDTYTPNQMLASRWWMGCVDPRSRRYAGTPEKERARAWEEVKSMYRRIDEILGEAMAHADGNTWIVLSSDHGMVPLDREVRLNNLFARKGLLKFRFDEATGEYEIDWAKTRAVFLEMDGIFLGPRGLAGNYRRASGEEYERLRREVTGILQELRDAGGEAPVERIVPWEKAGTLGLPGDRVGDLVVANKAGYLWVEDVSSDLAVFQDSTIAGYKQGILPETQEGMLTPFIIMGPGVRRNHRIEETIRHIDQYPTIMTLLGAQIPPFVEGKPLAEILASP